MEEFGSFWRNKMLTVFTRLDLDQNGLITERHWTGVAERFIKVAHLTGDKAERARHFFSEEIWDIYFKPSNPDAQPTSDVFIENLKKQGKTKLLAFKNKNHQQHFDAIDTDADGFIQLKELQVFFGVLGINEDLAKEAFNSMDTNHDGVISRGEFITAGNDFFIQENPGYPGDLFFGPLI